MKITYLGTAAAEGVPAIFCNCDICKSVKKAGGKSIRTRSQILIDEDLLLDFPMDTYLHVLRNNLDLSKVKNIFITHSHMDHLYPMELSLHGAPYAHNMVEPLLNVYGSDTVINLVKSSLTRELTDEVKKSLSLSPLSPYESVSLENMKITALPAVHTKNENCFIYLIEGDKTILQFNDSGILDTPVYEYMKDKGVKLDLINFDCTYGYREKGKGRHMGVLDVVNERERMIKYEILSNDPQFILTHFSHNGALTYEEMEKLTAPLGFIVAYDGMIIDL